MRFHTISAALVAATALISGVVAEEPVATTTLTRTLQRVVQTVTATRPSSGLVTSAPTGDAIHTNGTASYTQPSVTNAAPSSTRTGAAATLHFDTAGLAAVAGVIGYLAL